MTDARRALAAPVAWRLFLTTWLVYSAVATTNVVRETYLAISLGERLSVRVDPYQGLHPDLFEFPGRGWYINSNPGASMVGAVPYAILVRPAIALATHLRPGIAAPKPPAKYDDERPNRTRFLNEARARGLDITLGLAALGTGVTVMAPLGALVAVLMFWYLRARLASERLALALALVFAFATPILFRSAFLNQNVILAHLVFGAWILKVGLAPKTPGTTPSALSLAGIGALLGFGITCDYSAVPFALVFGLWILWDALRRGGARAAFRDGAIFGVGALASLGFLIAYQWIAFGHPLWPAQRYMPPTEFSVRGWMGFTAPTLELMFGNLFDLRYGLFAFCPLLLAWFGALLIRKQKNGDLVSSAELGWIAACFVSLLLFSSANQFANLQWNTGVRYMVPLVPLLFIASVPVLNAMPRLASWTLVAITLLLSLAVTMTRESVPAALRLLFSEGPTLPILLVLQRTASGYDLPLPRGAFWFIAIAISVVLILLWHPVLRRTPT